MGSMTIDDSVLSDRKLQELVQGSSRRSSGTEHVSGSSDHGVGGSMVAPPKTEPSESAEQQQSRSPNEIDLPEWNSGTAARSAEAATLTASPRDSPVRCSLCRFRFRGNFFMHAFKIHYNHDVITCSACEYTSKSYASVEGHLINDHKHFPRSQAHPLNNMAEHKNKIDRLAVACFGRTDQPPQSLFHTENTEQREMELRMIAEAKERALAVGDAEPTAEDLDPDNADRDEHGRLIVKNIATLPPPFCVICNNVFTNADNHASMHLNKKFMVSCSFSDCAQKSDPRHIHKHMKRKHNISDHTTFKELDNNELRRYHFALERKAEECFPLSILSNRSRLRVYSTCSDLVDTDVITDKQAKCVVRKGKENDAVAILELLNSSRDCTEPSVDDEFDRAFDQMSHSGNGTPSAPSDQLAESSTPTAILSEEKTVATGRDRPIVESDVAGLLQKMLDLVEGWRFAAVQQHERDAVDSVAKRDPDMGEGDADSSVSAPAWGVVKEEQSDAHEHDSGEFEITDEEEYGERRWTINEKDSDALAEEEAHQNDLVAGILSAAPASQITCSTSLPLPNSNGIAIAKRSHQPPTQPSMQPLYSHPPDVPTSVHNKSDVEIRATIAFPSFQLPTSRSTSCVPVVKTEAVANDGDIISSKRRVQHQIKRAKIINSSEMTDMNDVTRQSVSVRPPRKDAVDPSLTRMTPRVVTPSAVTAASIGRPSSTRVSDRAVKIGGKAVVPKATIKQNSQQKKKIRSEKQIWAQNVMRARARGGTDDFAARYPVLLVTKLDDIPELQHQICNNRPSPSKPTSALVGAKTSPPAQHAPNAKPAAVKVPLSQNRIPVTPTTSETSCVPAPCWPGLRLRKRRPKVEPVEPVITHVNSDVHSHDRPSNPEPPRNPLMSPRCCPNVGLEEAIQIGLNSVDALKKKKQSSATAILSESARKQHTIQLHKDGSSAQCPPTNGSYRCMRSPPGNKVAPQSPLGSSSNSKFRSASCVLPRVDFFKPTKNGGYVIVTTASATDRLKAKSTSSSKTIISEAAAIAAPAAKGRKRTRQSESNEHSSYNGNTKFARQLIDFGTVAAKLNDGTASQNRLNVVELSSQLRSAAVSQSHKKISTADLVNRSSAMPDSSPSSSCGRNRKRKRSVSPISPIGACLTSLNKTQITVNGNAAQAANKKSPARSPSETIANVHFTSPCGGERGSSATIANPIERKLQVVLKDIAVNPRHAGHRNSKDRRNMVELDKESGQLSEVERQVLPTIVSGNPEGRAARSAIKQVPRETRSSEKKTIECRPVAVGSTVCTKDPATTPAVSHVDSAIPKKTVNKVQQKSVRGRAETAMHNSIMNVEVDSSTLFSVGTGKMFGDVVTIDDDGDDANLDEVVALQQEIIAKQNRLLELLQMG